MTWDIWLILAVVGWLLFGPETINAVGIIPPHWQFISPSKRRAVRVALKFLGEQGMTQMAWSGCRCFNLRHGGDYWFVYIKKKGTQSSPSHWEFVVWDKFNRIELLGTPG